MRMLKICTNCLYLLNDSNIINRTIIINYIDHINKLKKNNITDYNLLFNKFKKANYYTQYETRDFNENK